MTWGWVSAGPWAQSLLLGSLFPLSWVCLSVVSEEWGFGRGMPDLEMSTQHGCVMKLPWLLQIPSTIVNFLKKANITISRLLFNYKVVRFPYYVDSILIHKEIIMSNHQWHELPSAREANALMRRAMLWRMISLSDAIRWSTVFYERVQIKLSNISQGFRLLSLFTVREVKPSMEQENFINNHPELNWEWNPFERTKNWNAGWH